MTRTDDDLRKEVETLQREVKALRKEVAELREFTKYLYIMLTEEGGYAPEEAFAPDYGKMNT